MNRVPNKIRPALHDAPYWRLYSLKKYTISRYIANHHIFTVQTLSYQNTSPIHKFILQGQHITQRSQQNAMCPVRKTPHSPKTLTPSYAQILGGADSMGHGGHVPPPFYKWLGTGAPWVEEQQTRNWPNYWPSRKRSPKRLIVLLEPKSGGARIGAPPPLSFRTGAPTFKLVPAPLQILNACVGQIPQGAAIKSQQKLRNSITCTKGSRFENWHNTLLILPHSDLLLLNMSLLSSKLAEIYIPPSI